MNWICQNQLCLPPGSAQLTTSRLWCFTAPMHVAGQKNREDRLKKKTKPRNLLVIFVPPADLNPFAMPLCCHVVVICIVEFFWRVQGAGDIGSKYWHPWGSTSDRHPRDRALFEFAAFFGGGLQGGEDWCFTKIYDFSYATNPPHNCY